jgi:pimeloyl-ACP methyl ester carboxylesterase
LHGFGSTKEDYADLSFREDFADRDLVFWDAPGCGQSEIDDPGKLSIPFLVDLAKTVCDELQISKFHLVGHSMGGLTALKLAEALPDRVLSFVSIEGNVAPEDCFLSRQILEHPADTPEAFMEAFMERVYFNAEYSSPLYATALPTKVRPSTFQPIFTSMVDLSDNTPLMEILAQLPMPRLFIHGEQNNHLSYLGKLPQIGVGVASIPHSGHFPMYSNPTRLWSELAKFIASSDFEQI